MEREVIWQHFLELSLEFKENLMFYSMYFKKILIGYNVERIES